MKKNYIFSLLMTLCLISASFGQVTLPHYDGFDYTVGTDIGTTTFLTNVESS